MNPDILTAPSSTLMSRLPIVDWFKGAVKMSEFFVGAEVTLTTLTCFTVFMSLMMTAE